MCLFVESNTNILCSVVSLHGFRLFCLHSIRFLFLLANTQIRFLLLAAFSRWLVESWMCWSSSFTNGLATSSDLDDRLVQRSTDRRVVPCFTFDILIAGRWQYRLPVWLRTNTIQFQMKPETHDEANWRRVKKKKRKGREEVNGAGLLLAGGSGLAASGEQVVGVPNERNGFNLNDLTCLMNEETMQKKRAGGVFVCASVSLPSVLLWGPSDTN